MNRRFPAPPPGRPRAILIAVSLLAVAACVGDGGAGEPAAAWTAAADTTADTIRVHTAAGHRWSSDGRLVSKMSIGVLDGDPEYQFGSVLALAVGEDGTIYVLDGQGPFLRSYAPDGTYLADLGREGEGPGEYKRPDSGLGVLPDGRIVLRDPGNGRISVYRSDGTHDASWPIASSLSTNGKLVVADDGSVLTPIVKNLGASASEWERGMARYRPDGTLDTLDVPDLGFEESVISGKSGNSSSSNRVPFTPDLHYVYSPRGYFIAGTSDDYSFVLLRVDEPVLRISRTYEPAPVLPEEAEIERERLTAMFRNSYPGWRWNGPPIPVVKPAYAGLLAAADGRIWVRRHTKSRKTTSDEARRVEEDRAASGSPTGTGRRSERSGNPYTEPVVFDVFEPDGTYLGRVDAPEDFALYPVPVFRGDTVWAVVRDDLDVSHVHRFEIEFDGAK